MEVVRVSRVPLSASPPSFALLLELKRPDKLHAFDAEVYSALRAALAEAEADADVLAAVLCSRGRIFSAGADLTAPAHPGEHYAPLMRDVAAFSKLLVAAVQGPAVGIAATLLLHCDIVHAAADAFFSTPFAEVGVVPEAASSLLLPLRVGTSMATEMLLAGRRLSAQEALRCGIVSAVVATADMDEDGRAAAVLESVLATLRRIAALPMARVATPLFKSLTARWCGAHAGDGRASFEAELPWLVHRYERGDPFVAAAARAERRSATIPARL